MSVIHIDVIGTPIPQGSKRGFRAGDRIVMVDASGQELGLWRENVARVASPDFAAPLRSHVTVTMQFRFARPLGHFGKKGLLPSAPTYKVTKPDIDKLVRAVLDALTGVAWVDDAQVISVFATKAYAIGGAKPGASIGVQWDD